jgi:hypothetical protein
MKKLLVLMLALLLTLGLAACGGAEQPPGAEDAAGGGDPAAAEDAAEGEDLSDSDDAIGFSTVSGNGLSLEVPADIEYAQTNEASGSVIFADEYTTAVITLGPLKEDSRVTSADITDEVLLSAMSLAVAGGTLDTSRTVEHDGGVSVVGYGKWTVQDDITLHSVLQYFFPADGGGYYTISYLYVEDAGSSLEDTIDQVISSVRAD